MLRAFAPAKLNLYLHVTGRLENGYHTLDSLAVFLDEGDWLAMEPAESLELYVQGEFADGVPVSADNLVLRAAMRLREETGTRLGARMVLDKRIPVGAGLGGGSADAAAALLGLNRLWALRLEDAALARIASSLGSDVAACLSPRPVRMQGMGNDLTAVSLEAPLNIVLVHPRIALLTAEVYRCFQPPFAPEANLPAPLDGAHLKALMDATHNGLTPAACRLMPDIELIIDALARQPGCFAARMSGSGSACFGLFGEKTQAQDAAKRLTAAQPGWWVRACGRYSGARFL